MRSIASVPANMAATSPRMKSSGSLLSGSLRTTPSMTASRAKRTVRSPTRTQPRARSSAVKSTGFPVSGSRTHGAHAKRWRKRAAAMAGSEAKSACHTGSTAERSSPSGVRQRVASIGKAKGVPRKGESRVCDTGEPPALCIHGSQFHGASHTPKARLPRDEPTTARPGSVRAWHHRQKASHVSGGRSGSSPAARTRSLR